MFDTCPTRPELAERSEVEEIWQEPALSVIEGKLHLSTSEKNQTHESEIFKILNSQFYILNSLISACGSVLFLFTTSFTALLLLISIMRTTYASLLNYDSSLSHLITGRTFICGFQYPAGPIKRWYFLVTFFLAIALPYYMLSFMAWLLMLSF